MPAAAPPRSRAVVGVALGVLLVVLPACTASAPSTGSRGAVASDRDGDRGAAAATSASAELQAGLTALLVERAHLVSAASAAGGPREAAPAREALAAASTALADLLGASYGAARDPLRRALRAEDEALARAAGQPDDTTAEADLAAAHRDLAVVLRRVVPTLDADELAGQLAGIDLVQRSATTPERYPSLRAARERAAVTARLLATAVAADRGLPSPSTRGPLLRAALTGLLVEHACLAAELAGAHGSAADPVPARAALSDNGRDVADLLGDAYPALRASLDDAWQGHLRQLDQYGAARAGGAVAAAEAVAVRAFPADLARLLAEHVEGLPATSAAAELAPALDALLVAVDTAAEGSAAAPSALRVAVSDALPLSALLASAVAEDLQLA